MTRRAVYNVSETGEGGETKMEGRIEKHTMSSGQDIKRETNTPLQDFKGSADHLECTRAHTLPSCCVLCDSISQVESLLE